jgi:hypothetical protein
MTKKLTTRIKDEYIQKMDALKVKVRRLDQLEEGERMWLLALIDQSASNTAMTWGFLTQYLSDDIREA